MRHTLRVHKHWFQLVYACGSRQPLFARPERVCAIQPLLHSLTQLADGAAAGCPELHRDSVAVWPPAAERPAGSFCCMQLLSGGPLEAALPALHARLAGALLASPPYELRWLSGCHDKEAVLQFITDPSDSYEQLMAAVPGLSPDQADQLLVLRGLLACNMLQHCLQKRHNVDFGINRSPTARKKLAVPYRAAHTPSERSEFAQPDVALLLTHISYYADGLSMPQFEQVLQELLGMGDNAKRDHYRGWLQLLPPERIEPDDLSKFDCVNKVDPTNAQQLDLMWQHLRCNMAVIDLWLSYCLLPDQTSQFPQRLTRNAWHLADNAGGAVVGFSGTNDNHRLLPLQVHQADASHKPHLAATNGKMLAMLLQHAGYTTLDRQDLSKGGKPVWQLLLDFALQHKLHALLDCGALLAGTTNRKAAHYVLQHMDTSRYQGVCYVDSASCEWTICDSLGRSLPRQASAVAERDAFVIFDEARCRGADLKLTQQAVGLLTLAPGMGKSQLMQAAGRLRQLGRGQTLRLVGLPDVTEKILAANAVQLSSSSSSSSDSRGASRSSSVTMQQVLQWVMSNTVQATLHGVTPWASQGLYFTSCKASADMALQEDDLLPAVLYGSSKAPRPVPDVVAGMIKQCAKGFELRCLQEEDSAAGPPAAGTAGAASTQLQLAVVASTAHVQSPSAEPEAVAATSAAGTVQQLRLLVQQIQSNASKCGEGHWVVAGAGVNEECERELEQEEEQEKEQEVQVARVDAAAEQDWQYTSALAAASASDLSAFTGICSLSNAMPLLQTSCVSSISWSSNVFVTSNFMLTTAAAARAVGWGSAEATARAVAQAAAAGHCLSQHLCPVGSMLAFKNGDLLLLSEREAEGVLEHLWTAAATGSGVPGTSSSSTAALLSLSYARLACSAAAAGAAASTAAAPLTGQQFLVQPPQPPIHSTPSAQLPQLVTAHLFSGGSMYDGDPQQLQLLHSMVRGRREAAEALLDSRGRQSQLPRSELELACDEHMAVAKRVSSGVLVSAAKRPKG